MVDLGWPWWVTTAIALCVVAAGAVVFAIRREPAVRAVAAVLVIEAVAIAVIAPFVMENDDHGSRATVMSPSANGVTPLSPAEFVRRADANCTALGKRSAPLGEWPPPSNLEATATYLDRFLPLFDRALRNQSTLRPPSAEQPSAAAWMHAMTAMGHALETVRYSAKAHDPATVRAGYRASDAATAKSTTLSKRLGLKVCFS